MSSEAPDELAAAPAESSGTATTATETSATSLDAATGSQPPAIPSATIETTFKAAEPAQTTAPLESASEPATAVQFTETPVPQNATPAYSGELSLSTTKSDAPENAVTQQAVSAGTEVYPIPEQGESVITAASSDMPPHTNLGDTPDTATSAPSSEPSKAQVPVELVTEDAVSQPRVENVHEMPTTNGHSTDAETASATSPGSRDHATGPDASVDTTSASQNNDGLDIPMTDVSKDVPTQPPAHSGKHVLDKAPKVDSRDMDDGYHSCKIYIGNLPERTEHIDLEDCFGQFGKIAHVELKLGFAFIEYSESKSASQAIETYHEGHFLGNQIKVEASKARTTQQEAIESNTCFTCGEHGHYARQCPKDPRNESRPPRDLDSKNARYRERDYRFTRDRDSRDRDYRRPHRDRDDWDDGDTWTRDRERDRDNRRPAYDDRGGNYLYSRGLPSRPARVMDDDEPYSNHRFPDRDLSPHGRRDRMDVERDREWDARNAMGYTDRELSMAPTSGYRASSSSHYGPPAHPWSGSDSYRDGYGGARGARAYPYVRTGGRPPYSATTYFGASSPPVPYPPRGAHGSESYPPPVPPYPPYSAPPLASYATPYVPAVSPPHVHEGYRSAPQPPAAYSPHGGRDSYPARDHSGYDPAPVAYPPPSYHGSNEGDGEPYGYGTQRQSRSDGRAIHLDTMPRRRSVSPQRRLQPYHAPAVPSPLPLYPPYGFPLPSSLPRRP